MTEDKATESKSLAERIADNLFTNGSGEVATHLQLHQKVSSDKSIYLGGYSKQSVIDVINEVINGRK